MMAHKIYMIYVSFWTIREITQESGGALLVSEPSPPGGAIVR